MKIKIKEKVPVEERIRPVMGEVYEVTDSDDRDKGGRVYFIKVNGERVGVLARECAVLPEVET